MSFEEFHLIRPYWLLAIVPLLVMLWLLLRRQLNSGNWEKVCDPQLLPHILLGKEGKRRTWPFYTMGIAGLLSILALAGPTWERLPQPAFRDQSALVIVLDLSRSMDATDIKPSRLIRARFKVADILKQREEGQTALIVYARDAFVVTPLTDDVDTITSLLSILNTALMPSQGSHAEIALERAMDLLKQAGLKTGGVLLITDGFQGKKVQRAIDKLNRQGYKLSILGVGTEEGAPIPLAKGGFLKDAKGAIVIPKLDEFHLREVVQKGDGIYQRIRTNESDVLALLAAFDSQSFQNKDENLQIDTWRELGPWLLLLVLPLAALAFRRGYWVIILLFFVPIPTPVQAYDFQSLWLTADQQAKEAFEKEEMQQAAELFEHPEWKAAAQYKSNQYEEVLKSLDELEGAENWYNKGNALARLARYPEAIEAYKKALELEPEHEDAKYNKELVEKQVQDSQDSQDSQDTQDSQNQDQQEKKSEQDSQDSQDSQDAKNQEAQEQEAAQKEKKSEQDEQDAKEAQVASDYEPLDEKQQAHEQWLRKIHDDPGGLWRRKFKYQYQQGNNQSEGEQPW